MTTYSDHDVRNGRGFAGVKTGDGFNPISEPRGLPVDVSAVVRSQSDSYGIDGHSHSFLTVAELLAYDWAQTSTLQGVLHAVDFYKWERWGRAQGQSPDSYSGDVSGRDVVKISEGAMRELLKPYASMNHREAEEAIGKKFPHHYTTCTWTQAYYQCASNFLSQTLPRLWRLGKPEDVRVVFWFDN